jgi:predicted ATP-grasp superfamily ATP-dependent carboligase
MGKPKYPAALPPVFVMNTYYTGMGIARNLHGYGVPVYGLTSESDAPGVRSRFFKAVYRVPNGRDEPEELCGRLLDLRERHDDAPVLFPTRDADVMFLHHHRRELEPRYRIPQNSAVESLLDKFALFQIATSHGITAPVTIVCASMEEITAQAASLRYPVVVKPRVAEHWRTKKAWRTVSARKAFLVESIEDLQAQYLRLSSVSPEVMIQEYVSGSDCDIAVCCCFMDPAGEMPAFFTARKLRQNPPLFGTGCAVETIHIPEIVPLAKRVLQAAGYCGIAEVEFKRHSCSGTWFLIEVNPRHWDQHEIGAHIGVNLSWIAYQHMIGRPLKPQIPAKPATQFKWIAETEALMLLLRNVYVQIQQNRRLSRSLSQRWVLHFGAIKTLLLEIAFLLKGRKVFAILHRSDPMPGLLLCIRTARELCELLARRLTAHWRTRPAIVD